MRIKDIIIDHIQPLWALKISYLLSTPQKFDTNTNGKKAYIFLAADYGNLGDVAITYSQGRIIREVYPEHELVEVPRSTTIAQLKYIVMKSSNEDVITIVGGGNMGDRYDMLELYRQLVCWAFKGSKIISFPQSVEFSNSKRGQQLYRSAQCVYSRPNISLIAREGKSYNLLNEYFSCHCFLTPDVVMTMKRHRSNFDRKDVLLCFRDDEEKSISNENNTVINSALNNLQLNTLRIDTHIGESFDYPHRYEQLELLLEKFESAKLVITDRLHGMIFSFITGTPAIVLPNSNGKIAGCYEWIKDCGFIFFVEKFDKDTFSKMLRTLYSVTVDEMKIEIMKNSFLSIIKETVSKIDY